MSASCHYAPTVRPDPHGRQLVLAGNPNVGKSVLFFALTGIYTDVSNFPGTTVQLTSGRMGPDLLVDTPGAYGLSPFSEDERVARDIILAADLVVNVVDATHLERDLFLTLQLLDMGLPVVVALNMMDEVRRLGVVIDTGALAQGLGVAILPIAATQGVGIKELKAALMVPRSKTEESEGEMIARRMAMLDQEDTQQEQVYGRRRLRADAIAAKVARHTHKGTAASAVLGRLALHPLAGLLMMAGVLWGLYQVIGVWVAQDLVGFTEGRLMLEIYEPFVRGLSERWVPVTWMRELLTGEFGLMTMTVTYLIGLLLPLVVAFYIAVAVLEDSGYLPRIAVLADRALTGVGLNGRAIIPIILGFGCVTMATLTTRMLESKRERQIATFLLALAIPCSAQLAVIAAMVSSLGGSYVAAFVAIILAVFGVIGVLLNQVLPGESTTLLIDLPPMRLPRLMNVLRKAGRRSWMFLTEAGPVFAMGAVLISLLQMTGALDWLQQVMQPLTVSWLGLPPGASIAFVMGFVRRDFGAAGLYDLNLTPAQTLVALVVITLFVPCIAAFMIMMKERGRREGVTMWLAAVALAFLVGGVVYRLMPPVLTRM